SPAECPIDGCEFASSCLATYHCLSPQIMVVRWRVLMTTTKRTILALAIAIVPATAFATHVPPGNEKVQYDGPLVLGATGVKGTIGWKDPLDGYDWYCMDVIKGRKVTIGAKRTAGDLKMNIGVLKGLVANDGDPRSGLPSVVNTSNSSDPDTVLNF